MSNVFFYSVSLAIWLYNSSSCVKLYILSFSRICHVHLLVHFSLYFLSLVVCDFVLDSVLVLIWFGFGENKTEFKQNEYKNKQFIILAFIVISYNYRCAAKHQSLAQRRYESNEIVCGTLPFIRFVCRSHRLSIKMRKAVRDRI